MDTAEKAFDAASGVGGGGVTDPDSGLVDVATSGPYELTQENQWGWITLYVVTIVLAILLNLLFIVGGLCTRRTRTTGYYLLLNLSLRDILVAALCVPFTLDSEIIALTWNYGDKYCIAYRFFYHCFLALLPFTLLFLAFHLFVENCKWNFAGEGGSVPRPWPHTIYLPLIWFFSAAYAVPTVFLSAVRDEPDDIYRNVITRRDESSAKVSHNRCKVQDLVREETCCKAAQFPCCSHPPYQGRFLGTQLSLCRMGTYSRLIDDRKRGRKHCNVPCSLPHECTAGMEHQQHHRKS